MISVRYQNTGDPYYAQAHGLDFNSLDDPYYPGCRGIKQITAREWVTWLINKAKYVLRVWVNGVEIWNYEHGQFHKIEDLV